jgi:uncharacterized membrane protein
MKTNSSSPAANTIITERKKILALYIFFFAVLYLSFLSPPVIAALSLMACICILAGLYSIRANAKEDTLIKSHASFMIRTFWRANLYLIYSTMLGMVFLVLFIDYSPFFPCMDYLSYNWITVMQYWDFPDFIKLFKRCYTPFIKSNTMHVVAMIFIIIFPVLIYLLNRFILGWTHARRGLPVNP